MGILTHAAFNATTVVTMLGRNVAWRSAATR